MNLMYLQLICIYDKIYYFARLLLRVLDFCVIAGVCVQSLIVI